MLGKAIGGGFVAARDAVARRLIRLGTSPDGLSLTGTVFTALAAVGYALGSSAEFGWSLSPEEAENVWLLVAGSALVLASACDMLDGAVARLGHRKTDFGAFLDSSLDRVSDFAIYAGIAAHYAWKTPANLTFILAAMWAFFNAFMISYTRARAEDLIAECKVGFWQRGERSTAILIGTFAYHVPAILAQQALLTWMTASRRMSYTRRVLAGRKVITDPRDGTWWDRIRVWRWPRMTVPYDLTCAINIGWLLLADLPHADPLRALLAG